MQYQYALAVYPYYDIPICSILSFIFVLFITFPLMQGPSQWEQEAVSGASLAASEASPPASGYPVLTNQRPSLPGIKQSEARELRSSAMNPFPSPARPSQCANSVQKENCIKGAWQTTIAEMYYDYVGSWSFFISFTFSSLSSIFNPNLDWIIQILVLDLIRSARH